LFQVYHNFVLPHASLRQRLPLPEATNGSGSARLWRPCPPAMAAGLTDHVWSLREVLMFRVPPCPSRRWSKTWPRLMIVMEGLGVLRCRPRGVDEGLKTDLESC
jgi:hypothetical protein